MSYDNRYVGGTVTRHYYTVRFTPYTIGIEYDVFADAVLRAKERLALLRSQGRLVKSIQVDTRVTIALATGGSEDFPIAKTAITE